MSTKAVSLPKHITVVSGTIAPTCIVHAWSHEHNTGCEARLRCFAHADIARVDTNKMIPAVKTGSLRPLQGRNIDNVVKTVHQKPSERREDYMNNHTQLAVQKDTEENVWRSEVQESHDYITYQAKFSSVLSKFQHMWDGKLSQIKAAKHRIELISSDERPIHSAPYQTSSWARDFEKHEIEKNVGNGCNGTSSNWMGVAICFCT